MTQGYRQAEITGLTAIHPSHKILAVFACVKPPHHTCTNIEDQLIHMQGLRMCSLPEHKIFTGA
jgi:hypothetical protein